MEWAQDWYLGLDVSLQDVVYKGFHFAAVLFLFFMLHLARCLYDHLCHNSLACYCQMHPTSRDIFPLYVINVEDFHSIEPFCETSNVPVYKFNLTIYFMFVVKGVVGIISFELCTFLAVISAN